MRNVRTAAAAGATALTVALGGVATASAETPTQTEANEKTTPGQAINDRPAIFVGEIEKADGTKDKPFSSVVEDGFKGLSSGQGLSQFFNDTDKLFYGVDAFGKQTHHANVPQWARYWIDYTVVALIGSVVGLTIAGLNWANVNGLLNF
ncbi:hypothetical protein [Corynebacterium timonense]|uniref:Secreted protein n=1 Tax=Corynebacterium timonense TaxID=441500 RepID=A0A1H1N3X8_9CORY|nr:hypothetical protein [Corynebacterium timonense]SDR92869.1 hypothetical protein SAMN04488539_0663 [Corynebacterium timonense]